ncbi:MAG: pilus assembly protein [Lachnospiraceae bacterium]|nr:pilus assembly protein [Lachnospiraceae bacterium]
MLKGRSMASEAKGRSMASEAKGRSMASEAKGSCKASVTVEGALVMFLVLMVLMGCMQMAISLHQQVVERAGVYWVELEDADWKFRLYSLGREVLDGG